MRRRVTHRTMSTASNVLLDNGVVRVEAVLGKGLGMVAARHLPADTQIFAEDPIVRVNKDTSRPATKLHPVAGPKMQRVHELARQGGFDPGDFETWPDEVVTLLREVLDHQADFVYAIVGDDTKEKWMELGDSWASGDETKTPGGVVSQDPSQHTHAPLYKCLTISQNNNHPLPYPSFSSFRYARTLLMMTRAM